ncbi:hypothetical protein GGI12_006358, partial [Dipsacomyces acuminosporus]
MSDTGLRVSTYLAVYERTAERRILHLSSSVRRALFSRPFELMGQPIPHFIADILYVTEARGRGNIYTDGNVILSSFIHRRKDNIPVYMRTTVFVCGIVNIGLVTVYSNNDSIAHIISGSIPLEELNSMMGASEQEQQMLERILQTNSSGGIDLERINHSLNSLYSLRTGNQACMILESVTQSNSIGPRVLYCTNSIKLIINAGADSIHCRSFLTLVSLNDIVKASMFLELAFQSNKPVYEQLELIHDPVKDRQLGNPKCVTVDLMSMKCDYGAILVCQLHTP